MVLEIIAEFVHVNPLLGVLLVSLVVAIFISIVNYFIMDKVRMKELKDIQKACQIKLKDSRGNPEKMAEINKQMMACSTEMMKHSFKPMLITFIPIIIIFGWANANIAFQPINPGEDFIITIYTGNIQGNIELMSQEGISAKENPVEIRDNKAEFTLNGKEGDYFLKFDYNNEGVQKKVIITKGIKYAAIMKKYKGNINQIVIGNKKLVVINLFGWEIGWLGSYIISSIIFSMILRKVFKLP